MEVSLGNTKCHGLIQVFVLFRESDTFLEIFERRIYKVTLAIFVLKKCICNSIVVLCVEDARGTQIRNLIKSVG